LLTLAAKLEKMAFSLGVAWLINEPLCHSLAAAPPSLIITLNGHCPPPESVEQPSTQRIGLSRPADRAAAP
jgi:hypothetical protein